MADINLVDYGDYDNSLDSDYYNDGDGYSFDPTNEPVALGIEKLEQYLNSDNGYTRQLLSGGLLEILRTTTTLSERKSVLDAINRLSTDEEPAVRAELLENIPHIAEYVTSHQSLLDGLSGGIASSVLPPVVRCLSDSDNGVRTTARNSLEVLLEHRVVDDVDLEGLVCPTILEMLMPDCISEEYRTEAISFMVTISPLVPLRLVETQFLPKFCDLCSEHLFHIRKACATNFGKISRAAGPELSEKYLLPKFYGLCEDGIWGVRRACTECFMEVSNSLSKTARKNELARLFVGLLCDQSRWVRMAAFQALGPFISTFADPNSTQVYYDSDGQLHMRKLTMESYLTTSSPPTEAGIGTEPTEETENADHTGVGNVESSTNKESLEANGYKSPSQPPWLVPTAPEEDLEEVDFAEDSVTIDNDPKELARDQAVDMEVQSLDTDMDLTEDATKPQMGDGDKSNTKIQMETTNLEKSVEELRYEAQYPPRLESGSDSAATEGSGPEDFGSFRYWRNPPPVVDVAAFLDQVAGVDEAVESSSEQAAAKQSEARTELDKDLEALDIQLEATLSLGASYDNYKSLGGMMFGPTSSPMGITKPISNPPVSPETQRDRNESGASSTGDESSGSLYELMSRQQDVIPPPLLENYLSMSEPTRAQTVDTDIAQHCAYSLPAVAYTLGRHNWGCIKALYENLVSDMQWKVRRTLAFSIHELALILGPEITQSDLVPIFNAFIKDLDEVRIGILTHLADFVKLLDEPTRRSCLPKLVEFVNMENHRIWRNRYDLTVQLVQLCECYTCDDICQYMVPLAMELLVDEVAEVRLVSLQLISGILSSLKSSKDDGQRLMLINDLIEKLALSGKWHARQTYVFTCQRIIMDNAMPLDQFAKQLLPSVITLSADKTANVRLAVAKLISQSLMPLDYFTSSQNPHHDDLIHAEGALKSDTDRDVRHFVNLAPQTPIDYHSTVEV